MKKTFEPKIMHFSAIFKNWPKNGTQHHSKNFLCSTQHYRLHFALLKNPKKIPKIYFFEKFHSEKLT